MPKKRATTPCYNSLKLTTKGPSMAAIVPELTRGQSSGGMEVQVITLTNDGTHHSFNKTFDTHFKLCRKFYALERINGIKV
ncbi:hypothetical protein L195_g040058, partial [Trifolium pratense]